MNKFNNAKNYDQLMEQLKFESAEYAENFRALVEDELHFRIGKHIIDKVGLKKMSETDSIKNTAEAANWLKRNCPDFEDIVNEQKLIMYKEILKNRDSIPFLIKEPIEN